MKRRDFLTSSAAGALALGAPSILRAQTKAGVLRFVPEADVVIFDPVTTPSWQTRDYAYLVYDTLYGMDEKNHPQPQMVEAYTVSPDGLAYRFTLRAGLKFHDGQPVKTSDVIQSINRWAARDSNGTILRGLGMQLAAVDDRTFTLTLKEPWGLVLDSLAKDGSYAAFVMREQEAKTDPNAVTRVLQGAFGFLGAVARLLPFLGVLVALGGIALGALGWVGRTTLVLDLAGSERLYAVRGRNPGLLDFSEAIGERLMSLKR